MNCTRRELTALLAALPAASTAAPETNVLPSKAYSFDQLPAKKSANGNEAWEVFNGKTHNDYPIDLHITELAPGNEPHPPHHHVHEEIVMIIEGSLAVTISGNTTRLGPGGLAYVASNEEHGWRNTGTTPTRYFVMAIGRQSA